MSEGPAPAATPMWRSTRVLAAAMAVFAAAAVVLGVLLALGVNGGGAAGPEVVIQSCKVGEPGCTLRQAIHEHADFALYIRGQRFDFNKPQFVSTEDKELSPVAHIHEPRHTVVHVHMSGTTWDEFFRAIGIELTDPSLPGVTPETSCIKMPDGQQYCASGNEKLNFRVNGVKVDGISFREIHDLDRVLISFGSEDDAALQAQAGTVSDEACIPSERCKDRIPKDAPPEPCSISIACAKPGS